MIAARPGEQAAAERDTNGDVTRLHWPFADPSSFTGTPEEKLTATRQVRDEIREKLKSWIASES